MNSTRGTFDLEVIMLSEFCSLFIAMQKLVFVTEYIWSGPAQMPNRHCQKKEIQGKPSDLNQVNFLAHNSLKTFTNIVSWQFPGAEGGESV